MKKTLAVLLLCAAGACAFAGGAKDSGVDTSLTDVQEKGVFVLGLDTSLPPLGFIDESNEIVGFDIDLAREVCARLGVELPEDEAGFIALHFVNAEYGTNIKDAFRFPNQLRDILEITSDELGIVLDERTLHYERFVTHLKFLLQRVYRNELLPNEEDELAELMQTKYPKEYACSCKIAEYIEKNTECRLSSEEVMYLAIHIRRVTMAENEE